VKTSNNSKQQCSLSDRFSPSIVMHVLLPADDKATDQAEKRQHLSQSFGANPASAGKPLAAILF